LINFVCLFALTCGLNHYHYHFDAPSKSKVTQDNHLGKHLGASMCWLDSYGRGVGRPVSQCDPNLEKDGLLCYPKCQPGYVGVGPVCWQTCPNGFPDHGAFCAKPAPYGRGAGYAIWDQGKCQTNSASGQCEKNGLMWYPTCKSGFHSAGCCICSPNCIHGQVDIGVSCAKKSYGRGAGIPMKCKSEEFPDAGLCYNQCQQGYKGIGPVCWNKCPDGLEACGLLCVESHSQCTQQVVTISSTVLVMIGSTVLIPFSGGASAAIAAAVVAAGSAGGTAAVLSQEICKPTIPHPSKP
jgi:hypothetical protein